MGAAKSTQPLGTQGLRAERHARDAERAPRLQPRAVERRRVRLDGRLDQREIERVAHRCVEARDLVRFEKARRPAANVERADRRSTQPLPLPPQLQRERVQVSTAQRARRRRGGEIAVRAARGAERDVDVEGDAHRLVPLRGSGRSASADSSAGLPRPMSQSRDPCANARRWLGFHEASSTTRSSPNSGSRSTYAVWRATRRAPDTPYPPTRSAPSDPSSDARSGATTSGTRASVPPASTPAARARETPARAAYRPSSSPRVSRESAAHIAAGSSSAAARRNIDAAICVG